MRWQVSAGLLVFWCCGAARGQSPQTPQLPVFSLADVHASPQANGGRMRTGFLSHGRYQVKNATLPQLIQTAWGVDGEAVLGGPGWLAEDRFDIVALAPPDSTPAERALMLRALLAERFGLVLHVDQKPLPVFALVRGKSALQLKRSEGAGSQACDGSEENGPPPVVAFTCHNTTMEQLASGLRALDASVTRPVADLTGLAGAWDFTIRYTPLFEQQVAAAAGRESPGIRMFDALEKAGLRLEPREHAMPVVVIDRVNRTPTENAPGVMQNLPSAPVEFEVAEIRPSSPGSTQRGSSSPGRLDLQSYTLNDLIQMAWQLDDDRIAAGPKWLDTDRFDVVAKVPPGASPDDIPSMLRSLIVERFGLKTHTEDRPVPVFLLQAGKTNRMKRADPANRPGCAISRGQTGTGPAAIPLKVYTCRNLTMAKFAELIRPQAAGYIRNPVVDLTGLKGAWDFELAWTRNDIFTAAQNRKGDDGVSAGPTGAITVFEAIDKGMGLKLEGGKKYPLPVLVLDHVDALTADQ